MNWHNPQALVALIFAIALMLSAQTVALMPSTPQGDAEPDWWTAYPTCDITPVQTKTWNPRHRENLGDIPWFNVNMGDIDATAHLFMRDRPLPVNGDFGDGSHAKVLWTFPEFVRGFSINAILYDDQGKKTWTKVEIIPPNEKMAVDWPSMMSLPKPGCWKFELTTTKSDGTNLHGDFRYYVEESPGGIDRGNSTPAATPAAYIPRDEI